MEYVYRKCQIKVLHKRLRLIMNRTTLASLALLIGISETFAAESDQFMDVIYASNIQVLVYKEKRDGY